MNVSPRSDNQVKARILLVHNFYNSLTPSGENRVVEAERDLLRLHGHVIREFFYYSDELVKQGSWGKFKGAISTPWNPFAGKALRKVAASFHADVVHVHNTFPMISPVVFHAVGFRAIRVMTLHNYRLFCPAAIPARNGKTCTQCIDRRSVWPALQYACYRASRVATLPIAFNVALHRKLGTWTRQVDAFIALSEFQRDLMVRAGLPSELVHVKPNFYLGKPESTAWAERVPRVIYVGRLSAEKGVETLVRAWLMWGASAPELYIVGEGELKAELVKLAATDRSVPIRFLGQLNSAAAQEEIARARLLVLPSQCFEGFPMVIREAFAFGTPVAVSDLGPLPAIVGEGENGIVFAPGDPASLLQAVQAVWGAQGQLEQMGAAARCSFENLYTDNVNYRSLMEIYQQAAAVNLRRRSV